MPATFSCTSLPEVSRIVTYGTFVTQILRGPCPDYGITTIDLIRSSGDTVFIVCSFEM